MKPEKCGVDPFTPHATTPRKRKPKPVVITLPARKAKGSSRNFQKQLKAERSPVLGDAQHTEKSLWLTPPSKHDDSRLEYMLEELRKSNHELRRFNFQ